LGLIFLHIYFLHVQGSTNPLGVTNHLDEVRFYPKYWVKDFFGILLLGVSLVIFLVLYNPFFISDPDNYVEANPLSNPKHITPEWYFLPFYGMLRSIPDKVKGVCIMFFAIIVLFFLPIIPFKSKTSSFCIFSQFFFWCFVCNFIFLGWLAAHPVVFPYTLLCAFSTGFYFFYLMVILPFLCYLESESLNYRKNVPFKASK
jgi:quinol-cytochrome oxidoreductase complex cytochrome b subunit